MNEITAESDKQAVEMIVREMANSKAGAQFTSHWANDVLWFNIPPFASRGVTPARDFFDKFFANVASCQVDFLEIDIMLSGTMAVVCSVQRVNIVLKAGGNESMVARETDCFEKKSTGWELIHQHASVPARGAWDGKIVQY